MARIRSAATTEESTPPDSASSTLRLPTCFLISSIWSAMKLSMFQLAWALQVSNTKLRSASLRKGSPAGQLASVTSERLAA